MFHPTEIEKMLDSMVYLVDTREHETDEAKRRWSRLGVWDRQKLDFGDYSAYAFLPDSSPYSLADSVVVERKMNLDELAMCFTSERPRFEREFERAKCKGARIYLLVENASYDAIYRHQYRSRLSPQAMIGSLMAWQSRYDLKVIFCTSMTSSNLIHDILRYEMRERLQKYESEE